MANLLPALKAAADDTRLRILRLVSRSELAVSDLTRILRQSQPRVSRHLKLLTEAGLIDRQKEGAWVFYRLAQQGDAAKAAAAIVGLLNGGDGDYARDDERLTDVRQSRVAAADAYFARHAAEWDALGSLHSTDADVDAAILDMLGDGPLGALLDIGTGTGRMLDLLGERASRAVGLDNSREMLAVARGKIATRGAGHIQVRHGDLFDLPADLGHFDTVLLHQVLHYFDDTQAALQAVTGVLNTGGRLLVVDFAPHDKEVLREQHAHRRLGFADAQMISAFTAAGLHTKEVRHLSGRELTITLWLGLKS
jgi:ubiquinone/menaquinone biosynthesis C-methylase UbiE/DNA-binding transcriptional ArsR family regulator